ncbi:hypothetical protein AB0395_46715, partial [Streptosporangium sp. NPDC051023]|uniref:hypothetical protein n=1 Tax=Streptosporangium sp. NPDC051023 TaxID=3155410 RepID=UPI00344F810F
DSRATTLTRKRNRLSAEYLSPPHEDHERSRLDALYQVGADEQVTMLAQRAATRVSFTTLTSITRLLDTMYGVEADEQAVALSARLPAAGLSGLPQEQGGDRALYRFGRTQDGKPAEPWDWDDLISEDFT